MMEIACNSYSLRAVDRSEAFRRLAAAGLSAVELWAGHAPYRDGAVRPQDVLRDADTHGIEIRAYCIGGLFGLPRPVVDERLERALWFARELGVELVTAILDPDVVRGADALATRFGMRIALENHWYTALARPADVRRALGGCSDSVGAAIDVGHFAFLGCDLAAVAKELGPRTLHVHLKAIRRSNPVERFVRRARRQYRMQAAAPDQNDGLDRFVPVLAAYGYQGLLAIEDESNGGDGRMLAPWRARAAALLAEFETNDGVPECANA